MKYTCLFLIITLFIACHSSDKKVNRIKAKTNLLKPNNINKLVIVNHVKLKGISGNFNSFKAYLTGLEDTDPASIPYALDYIKTCLPVNLAERDSVMLLFNVKFFKIANGLTDSLETKYASIVKLMDTDSNSVKLKVFQKNLKDCGIGIFSTEGNYYLDVLPDYFYNNFKNRVSPGVRAYLDLRRHELAEGFSEDAGLLISFEQLYQRVKHWEKYLSDFPHTIYTAEAGNYYNTYLKTLLTGMDNSRVFEMDDDVITSEVKAVYEKAMKQDPNMQTVKIITDYYNLLGRHGFKDNDSVAVFLKEHKLSTMLGVQPDTR
jgi:hypothetical protein